jgi:SAM-dependent methyltransferase
MKTNLPKVMQLLFSPDSPVAFYRNPQRIVQNMKAFVLNLGLRIADRIRPDPQVRCSICGWQGCKFGYAAGVSVHYFGHDDICLRCGSNKRTRVGIETLGDYVDFTQGHLVIMDIGAAASTYRYFRQFPHINYMTLDKFKTADVQSDVLHIALSSNSIDVVICCHLLEHITNYTQALAEIHRILRPGGRGLIVVPQTDNLAQTQSTQEHIFSGYGHVWNFGNDFAFHLRAAGFEVETMYKLLHSATPKPLHIVTKR